jgi:5-methylcytosine-specific restriction endonuclease McrA
VSPRKDAGSPTSQSLRSQTTPTWRQLSLAVIERDGACVQCGATSMLNAHHVIPREEGGPDVCRGHTGAMVDLALGSSERLC